MKGLERVPLRSSGNMDSSTSKARYGLYDPEVGLYGRGRGTEEARQKQRVLNDLVDGHVQRDFVRKVYGILCGQLTLTLLMALPFRFLPELTNVVLDTPSALWFALSLTILCSCMVSCVPYVACQFPTNYFLLLACTIAEALLVGVITAQYNSTAVLLGLGISIGVFAGLSVFACISDADFTGYSIYIIAFMAATFVVSIVAVNVGSHWLYFTYLWMGILLFSCFVICDTQMILGGKHHHQQLGVDDYVFASLLLYLDFVNILLYILSALDKR